MQEMLDAIHDYVSARVAEGFDTRDEIIGGAVGLLDDDDDDETLLAMIERITDEWLYAHYEAQAYWDQPTDCDKLDDAFARLEARGIVARQNFACCQTCGHFEIWGEIDKMPRDIDGYVFYHMQDTESACEIGELYLAYGSVERSDAAAVEIGWRVAVALRAAGLNVRWSGSLQQRIRVTGMAWRRRRPQS